MLLEARLDRGLDLLDPADDVLDLASGGAREQRWNPGSAHVQRCPLPGLLLTAAREASDRFAAEENIDVEWERIWQIEPILFDETLIGYADEAVREIAGSSHRLPSGPLHDAAEVARAGIPTVMLFVQSLRGLSHTKLEDTKEEHLELSVQALDRLASKTIDRVGAS